MRIIDASTKRRALGVVPQKQPRKRPSDASSQQAPTEGEPDPNQGGVVKAQGGCISTHVYFAQGPDN